MKKNLILGHTGFIGSSFFRRLREKGKPVQGFSSQDLDLTTSESVEKLAVLIDPQTTVYFFSCTTRDKQNDADTASLNLAMVMHVIRAVKKSGCAHLIFPSSIDVYGHVTEDMRIDEKTCLKPECDYSKYKMHAELLLRDSLVKTMPVTILRWGGIYGAGDTHTRPIRIFIASILAGKKITLQNGGRALRDNVFIEDLLNVLEETAEKKVTGTINVVSGRSVSLLETLRLVEKTLGRPADVAFGDDTHSVKSYRFDPSFFREKYPGIVLRGLEQGLKELCRSSLDPAGAVSSARGSR